MQSKRDSVTGPLPPWLSTNGDGFCVKVHLQPGARRSQVVGLHGDRLKVAVQAPPIEGRANAAVIKLIAERLGCRQSAVQIAAGASSRDKLLQVDNETLDVSDIVARLQPE